MDLLRFLRLKEQLKRVNQLPSKVERYLEEALDFVFPPRCAGCSRPGAILCQECIRNLDRLEGRVCLRCGRPFPQGELCSVCSHYEFPLVARSYARYKGPLVRALLELKYRPNVRLAEVMSDWLASIYRQLRWKADLVAPVPLGEQRLRMRGYNQAEMIARPLSSTLGLVLDKRALMRTRETRSQVGLDQTARWTNVMDAFESSEEAVKGRNVLIVDDLFTTGSTLVACARALREAGASEVVALTVGRA